MIDVFMSSDPTEAVATFVAISLVAIACSWSEELIIPALVLIFVTEIRIPFSMASTALDVVLFMVST